MLNPITYVAVGTARECGQWAADWSRNHENKQPRVVYICTRQNLTSLQGLAGPLDVVGLHSTRESEFYMELYRDTEVFVQLANFQVSGFAHEGDGLTERWIDDGLEFEFVSKTHRPRRYLWCVRKDGEFVAAGQTRLPVAAYFMMRRAQRRFERINS